MRVVGVSWHSVSGLGFKLFGLGVWWACGATQVRESPVHIYVITCMCMCTNTYTQTHTNTHKHTHTLGRHMSKHLAGFQRFTARALLPSANSASRPAPSQYLWCGMPPGHAQKLRAHRDRHISAHCMFLTVVITKNILLVWMWQKVTPSTTKIGSAVNFLFACPGAWCLLT